MQVSTQQWQSIQNWLQNEVGQDNFDSWLQPLQPCEKTSSNGTLSLNVPTVFMKDWVVSHYSSLIQQGVLKETGEVIQIDFKVPSDEPAPKPKKPAPKPEPVAEAPAPAKNASAGTVDALYDGNPLDPRFTFENFVTGKSNEFAYAAAKRIAESNDIAYNPFFLYGGVGLGKTHLMHAIAWQVLENFPNRKVLYISAEKFLHNFIRAIKDKNTDGFKRTFRNVDVLMIDDVQFIAGKDATQEEFFHTFNELINEKKQIILTADKSPHEMQGIEDRLRSRLGWGLATEVHSPNVETRIAILQKKAIQLGVEISDDVAMFLADKIESNVRELEGALNRLAAHATLVNMEITIDTAAELLKDLFRVYNREVTLDEIQKKVAEHYSIKVSDMSSSRRSRNVARPRQIAMCLCKTLTQKSYPEIGRSFGGRDHTTVMHAVKTIEKMREEDPVINEDMTLLEKLLKSA